MTWPQKAALVGIGILIAAGGYQGWAREQQRKGVLKYAIRDDVTVARAEKHRGDSLAQVVRTDTVRLFRRIATTDTLIRTKIDTAILRQTDTVTITVRELAGIDSTIRACRMTVNDCAALNEARQRQIDALTAQNRALQRLQPSILSRCGLSAGYGVTAAGGGRMASGVTLVAGCRFVP